MKNINWVLIDDSNETFNNIIDSLMKVKYWDYKFRMTWIDYKVDDESKTVTIKPMWYED